MADSQKTPLDIIDELDMLIALSQESEWQSAYLSAATLKVEKLASINKFPQAEALLSLIYPNALATENETLQVRLDLVKLRIIEQDGQTKALYDQFNTLLDTAKRLPNQRLAGSVYLAVGRAQSKVTDYANALDSLLKAYQIAERIDDLSFLDVVMNAIGNVNVRMRNFDDAILYYQRSLKNSQLKDAKYTQIVTLYNIGQAQTGNQDYEGARQSFNEGLKICEEIGDTNSAPWLRRGLADLAIAEGNWDQAIDIYKTILPDFEKSSRKQAIFNIVNGLLTAYIGIGDAESAKTLMPRSEKLLESFPGRDNKIRVNLLKARLSALENNFEQAYELITDNTALIYADHEEKIKKEINKLSIQLDVETQKNENRRLIQKAEFQQLVIAQKEKQEWLWGLIIALALVLLIIIGFALYRQILLRNDFKAMAHRDHLTKSPNRRAILSFAKRSYKSVRKLNNPISICLLDLDKFKNLNDTYGHDLGDTVLVAFAEACKKSLRPEDGYGRYGGEEWLLVITNSNEEIAQTVLDRIKSNFAKAIIEGLPNPHNVTFSGGVEQFDGRRPESLDALIALADEKLYLAKESGRNKIVY
ncbi:diguanylate cyclase [Glaciecola sp. MH2013]|uniref:tetratricopeptide repeat-containing diguanylate cyclase n=1 Tax=Glaciecola sp. MH2013 TaxID=2785524 RepID=UPI00189F6166|nr:diguanylate cyclase [Glaciecola sp. MH2013]MBF7073405.1 diguanylate cyclase [Glaciecola sp. MH2013]